MAEEVSTSPTLVEAQKNPATAKRVGGRAAAGVSGHHPMKMMMSLNAKACAIVPPQASTGP